MMTLVMAFFVAVRRTVPEGAPLRVPSFAKPVAMSSRAGPNERNSVSPASVIETERVVRARSLTFSRASNPLMAWLRADCDMPSRAAARVKLASSATTAKAARSLSSSRNIYAN